MAVHTEDPADGPLYVGAAPFGPKSHHSTGRLPAKHIIGGLLAAKAVWADRETTLQKLIEHLPQVGLDDSLDIGIAIEIVAFDYTPVPVELGSREEEIPLEFSTESDQLIHFGIRLFRQLQQLGTVLAIDMGVYESALARK